MNKKIIILLIFFSIFVLSVLMLRETLFENKNFSVNSIFEPQEVACNTNRDCVLSENHPSGIGVCVNKKWQRSWDKNPESKEYLHECLIGPSCSGPEFVAGGMRVPKDSCECIDKSCQIIDLSDYPGCQMIGCD